jgi:hypothetical protein
MNYQQGLDMRAFLCCLLLSCSTQAALALDVAGIPIDPGATIESNDLSLNGAGLRTKYFFKVYVAALYVHQPSVNSNQVISQGGAKRMQMILLRNLSAKQLIEALQQGLEKNLKASELASLQAKITAFENIMDGLKKASEGDRLDLDFIPGTGTKIRLNGQEKGNPIPGEDFYRALLMIWLGEEPAQGSLKQELLTNNH